MSGGGKSTMADLIPRFYDVQQGRVTVDGIDVRKLRVKSLRAEIGLVTQSTFPVRRHDSRQYRVRQQRQKLERVIAAAKLANAHDFISRLPNGYETMVGELGVRISGGERQRIAIARALLKDAPILILDEATSSLDSASERSVQEALEHLMENRTTLVIAHRLSTVAARTESWWSFTAESSRTARTTNYSRAEKSTANFTTCNSCRLKIWPATAVWLTDHR